MHGSGSEFTLCCSFSLSCSLLKKNQLTIDLLISKCYNPSRIA